DLVGIAKLVEIPHIIATTAGFPADSVADLIALAKKDPGKINYASAGLGSYPHLDMEKLQKAAAITLTHIPYKGGAGQMIPAIIAGEAPVAFLNLSSALPHVRSGRMKAIATTAPSRLTELPDVATMAEQGFSGIGTNAWQGMFAPAATPKPIVDKIYRSVAAVLSNSQMKEQLSKQMLDVTLSSSPAQFQQLVEKETHAWGDFLREAGIKIEERLHALAKLSKTSVGVSQPRFDLVVEKDLEIPVRDGAHLKADVFRPKSAGRSPVIINLGCYQKDKLWVPPPDLEEEPNEYMNWETVNPLWWVPRGYACVRVDGRGSG